MFTGVHTDLSYYPHKMCYGCKISKPEFKLNPCSTCYNDYCYDCSKGFVRTCKCSPEYIYSNSKGKITAKMCNRAECQQCKNKYNNVIICCGKNKYCKSRYFGYCDDCFGDRLITLSKQNLLPESRGYLIYIIKLYISELKKKEDAILHAKIQALEEVLLPFTGKMVVDGVELYTFTGNKTSQYIWSGYVADNDDMPINDLYVKEIVLDKYISEFGTAESQLIVHSLLPVIHNYHKRKSVYVGPGREVRLMDSLSSVCPGIESSGQCNATGVSGTNSSWSSVMYNKQLDIIKKLCVLSVK